MMKMRSLVFPVSALLLFAVSNAWAEHPLAPGEIDAEISDYTDQEGEGPFPAFGELDRNGDGQLDAEEVSHIDRLHSQFQAADVDQDGSLDQEEFSAFEVREGVMPGLDAGE